jgi:hypothetical protein
VKISQILRNGLIGTSIAVFLVTSSVAATRPNVAVPMSSSAASSVAAAQDGGDESYNWLAIGLGVLAIAIFALIIHDGDDDDEDELSPG